MNEQCKSDPVKESSDPDTKSVQMCSFGFFLSQNDENIDVSSKTFRFLSETMREQNLALHTYFRLDSLMITILKTS